MAEPRDAGSHVAASSDARLEAALRALGAELAIAGSGYDAGLAARVRARIESARPARATATWGASAAMLGFAGVDRDRRPRVRRVVVLALAATLVLAAIAAAAVGFDLPGLRIIFGPAPSSTPPVATPGASATRASGAGLGLGTAVSLPDARGLVDSPIALPTAPDPARSFWYLDPDGSQIDDTYRAVGDTPAWTRDGTTFRLESALGCDAAIALAATLR